MTAPSLITIVKRAFKGEAALPKKSTLLVAVSGGPDSMALLSATKHVADAFELKVIAHGVDHGLRAEASDELDLAETFAKSIDVPFARTRLTVARGGNLQERARIARWDALTAAARKRGVLASAIATAHHANDRAETLLMRLLRGSGLRGLAVLPPTAPLPTTTKKQSGTIQVVRPILRARRSDVMLHLERHAVPFARDPSNEDPHYLRTRVRSRVLPLLEELDPEIVLHLTALADEVGESTASRSKRTEREILPRDWTSSLPRSTQKAVADLLASRSTKARVWLPNGLVVAIDARAHAGNASSKR